MGLFDADTHVIECEHTWDYLEPHERQFRPVAVTSDDPVPALARYLFDRPRDGESGRPRKFWLIDGRCFPRAIGDRKLSPGVCDVSDVAGRLRMMDELGVDVQVLYPTFLLAPPSERPEIQIALARSYNRWLADVYSRSNARLPWALIPPLASMDATLAELEFGRDRGACCVLMRGVEGDRMAHDPHFFPLYQRASELDLPICIHAGNGNLAMRNMLFGDLFSVPGDDFYASGWPVLAAFNGLITAAIPERFPKLRFGFVEVGAAWVPYLVREAARRRERFNAAGVIVHETTAVHDKRLYVACRTDDDLPYILRWAGEDNLMIGTDFGHADTAGEMDALDTLRRTSGVEPRIIDKILNDNPRALYRL